MTKKWWMESVGYQIYPKSFYDTNNDGIGDINGIYEKLDYLSSLGVNLIWICPFYDSPMDDNGYDVRNFFDVAAEFGTMEDVKKLINKAHELGIKIILDYVLNHTSDEHPWFIESRSSKDNPYRDYYIWHDGQIKDGKKVEPTNWGSFFGGSCWQYDEPTDSYYMKIFSNKMPDLNWNNEKVQKEMVDIAKQWLTMGIDGFRIDAVSHLERAAFVDIQNAKDKYPLDWHKFSNLPKVHDYLKMLNKEVFSKYDCVTIGEVGGSASIESGLNYSAFSANELSMVFNFDHNWCNNIDEVISSKKIKVDVVSLKSVFSRWQAAFKDKGWLPLNWLNHDQPRLMSHYGNYKFPLESGKMLATVIHLMRGTPFIYQGEEIGMTNYPFEDVSQFNDITSKNAYYRYLEQDPDDPVKALKKASLRSRDNPRTPMQWSNEHHAGFSYVKPWMMVNYNYKKINVEKNLKNKNSLWYHYQELINLRRSSPYQQIITYGDFECLDPLDEKLFCYLRRYQNETLLVINSFSSHKEVYDMAHYEIQELVISNYKKQNIKDGKIYLKPFESIVFKVKEKL
ncbi:MAG: glucohydrolase [Tenericutes bacterium HGW-Tenericutes-3]|nr:MAG: glucohydrolase [Tenericutes bacterium HGW-Tenericutes-3]